MSDGYGAQRGPSCSDVGRASLLQLLTKHFAMSAINDHILTVMKAGIISLTPLKFLKKKKLNSMV
jgi:hypothetical protein